MTNTATAELPLGRAFRISELSGVIAKSMQVPPGRVGVVVYADGRTRLLQPGQRQALSVMERLRGLGAGLTAGYTPAGPFSAWFRAPNLLSGDGELVDAALLVNAQVTQPERFFIEYVLPRNVVPAGQMDLSSPAACDALDIFVRQYAAEDLAADLPTDRLLPRLLSGLGAPLKDQGLRLAGVELLSFSPSARRAEVAEKAQALYERIQDAAVRRQMADAENQLQLDDFVHQLDPELQRLVGLRQGDTPAPRPATGVKSWLKLKTEGGGPPWRILALTRKDAQQPATPEDKPRPNPRWWLPRTVWLVFVWVLSYILTRVIWDGADRLGWENPWELLSVIWIFAVSATLESIKALYEKREKINERSPAEAGARLLDDLTHNNRARVDALVRDTCGRELAHVVEMLNELRGRFFRSGNEDLALRIRTLEQKFEHARRRVLDPAVGPAPYLSDLKINRPQWEGMLDEDEFLLVRAAALTEDTRRAQSRLAAATGAPPVQGASAPPANAPDAGMLARLEDRLDEFMHHFETRSRAFRPDHKDMEPYRLG